MGVLEVRLNGGEPFIHHDIDKILVNIAKRRFRRVMITNGTLIDGKAVELLKLSKTIPTISLDDSIPEEHDKFRGVKGSFGKTLRGMSLLKKSGVDFGVNTCIHKRNLKRVGDIIDLAVDYGASKVAVLDLKELGRMKENSELVPSSPDYRKAVIGLRLLKSINKDIEVSLDVFMSCNPLRESIEELKNGYVSCSAGKTRLTIDSDGSVYPCNMVLSDKSWQMGNIKETKLYDIWFSKKWSFFRGGVRLEELKICPDCPYVNRCIDLFCRLFPYVKEGDVYALNPYCKRITD
jgi:radical SAM protein with 4Fe4S-binding SPASM domain